MKRAVVAGLGSIGRRHLANLRALAPDAEITVLRHRRTAEDPPAEADRVVYALDDALAARPQLAFICGPSATHAEAGIAFARSGAHLFVEKPLALDAADARRLLDVAAAAGRLVMVGYNLRFNDGLRALRAAAGEGRIGRVLSARAEVGQYLPDWRPGADYRASNSAGRAGGGVVFELSHELDYVRWLVGEIAEIDALVGRLSDLDIGVDDTAELLLSFVDGAIGSIHLDMTQRVATRSCRLIGTDGTLVWDGIRGETTLYAPAAPPRTLVAAATQERNAMYLAQTAHVLDCVRGTAAPCVDGASALRVVELAQAALRAARERTRVAV